MRWAGSRVAIAQAIHDTIADLTAQEEALAGKVLLRVSGNKLVVTGRDRYTTVSSEVAVDGAADGATCVDQRRIDDFLHRVTSAEASFALRPGRLRVKAGPAQLELPVQDPAAMIVAPFCPTRSLSVPTQLLLRSLRRVLAAAHEDAAHPTLWGVHLKCAGGALVTRASDSKRFARAQAPADGGPLEVTLTRRLAVKTLAILRDAPFAQLSEDGTRICAEAGPVSIVGPMPHARFPDLDGAMTGPFPSSCSVESRALREAVEAIRAVSDDAAVRVLLKRARLRLSVRTDEGDAAFPIESSVVGPDAEATVGLRDFRVACAAMDSETTTIAIGGQPHQVVQLDAAEGDGRSTWVLATRAP